jgi:cell division protein FtsL
MAACTTTYLSADYEVIRDAGARVADRNLRLMALQPQRRRGVCTPEFFFVKRIDNSRLVKTPDPVRTRQIQSFSAAMAVLLLLVMVYGLQHFSAIESGYRVESEKQVLDQLREENRQLRLSEAQLTQPGRIDPMARELGLMEPQPGQVIHPNAGSEVGVPALAQLTPPSVKNSF